MLFYIYNINRSICKNIINNALKKRVFLFEKARFNFFSDFVHTDDVTERFKHVKSSYREQSDNNENNLFFETDTSSKTKPEHLNNGPSLDDYSLENVESALLQFVPEYISSVKDDGNNTFMTPGQAFFLENKDKLMETVRKRYYEEKNLRKNQLDDLSKEEENISSLLEYDFNEESFGSYGSDYIPERNKEHLWDYNSSSISVPREQIELTKGVMPTINQIVKILEQEAITNISVVDMDKYERRDQGLYVIVATGTTAEHCRRVGRLLYNVITDLEIPFVSKVSYCCKSRNDEWIISHLGPLSVHLMVNEVRKKYSLEEFWSEHFLTKKDISQESITE